MPGNRLPTFAECFIWCGAGSLCNINKTGYANAPGCVAGPFLHRSRHMAEFVLRVGARSAQGLRSNNEDRFVADPSNQVFLVADGMGGQDFGERASGLAAEIIPRVVQDSLAAQEDGSTAIIKALDEANQAIIRAGERQTSNRRMGTTAVLAIQLADRVFVAGVGDSRAYLIRDGRVEQLTVD